MYRIFAILGLIALIGGALSCGSSSGSDNSTGAGGDTPTAAYKRLYDAVKAKDMNAIKAAMMKGDYDIFKGPLKDNTGKEVIPAGKAIVQTDPVLESMNYLVEGVIGKV